MEWGCSRVGFVLYLLRAPKRPVQGPTEKLILIGAENEKVERKFREYLPEPRFGGRLALPPEMKEYDQNGYKDCNQGDQDDQGGQGH